MNCVSVDSIKKKSNLIVEISCPFTGVCFDHDFLQNIINFIKSPNNSQTWGDLIETEKVLSDLLDRERESQLSDEYILATIEANDYEFNEDGTIY